MVEATINPDTAPIQHVLPNVVYTQERGIAGNRRATRAFLGLRAHPVSMPIVIRRRLIRTGLHVCNIRIDTRYLQSLLEFE